MFKILHKDKNTKARLGVLNTPHGPIKTPSYVMVATYGHISHLSPADIKKTKTQILISNTYHLWPKVPQGAPLYKGAPCNSLLCQLLGTKLPTMTDSGGFQVFSLAFGNNSGARKIFPTETSLAKKFKRKNVRITDKGVYFKLDGKSKFLSPGISMQIQQKLGADIIFAFDECTYLFDTFKYNKEAMRRTHDWAKISLKEHDPKQLLFGIIQGGRFKSLRVQSAKYIGSLPFDGFGIGGSFGKKEMVQMLKWVIPYLPDKKPRHLLGVGKIDDIFRAVGNGVDLFDCVIPTREARHGRLYTATGHIDIRRGAYVNDKKVIELGCKCPTCTDKIPRFKIRELIKNHDPKKNAAGQRWCLLHNIWFFNNFVEQIRISIAKDKFQKFKKKYLSKFKS